MHSRPYGAHRPAAFENLRRSVQCTESGIEGLKSCSNVQLLGAEIIQHIKRPTCIQHNNMGLFEIQTKTLTSQENTWCAYKSLARPTSRCILFDGENFSFDASLVIYIYY